MPEEFEQGVGANLSGIWSDGLWVMLNGYTRTQWQAARDELDARIRQPTPPASQAGAVVIFLKLGKLLWSNCHCPESGFYLGMTPYKKMGLGFYWRQDDAT